MTDFTRINAPRVEKIAAMIATIRKSARSQKISDEDVAALLAPVAAQFGDTPPAAAHDARPAVEHTREPIRPPATLRETPHIQQIAAFVASLPSEQLPSYITHLVNRLCERAAGHEAEG